MTEDESFLVPTDTYFKAGIHIGTKFKTKYMAPFIYKMRTDGLSILNVSEIDKRIRVAAKFLAQYEPNDIIVVARRENGWRPALMFGKVTGARIMTGRYQPGRLTNCQLETFTEAKVLLATDAWPDRNAIRDAFATGMSIVSLCDTNNEANYIDLVIPANNKGRQSLGLMFYLLAREIMKEKGVTIKEKEEDFVGEE